MNYKEFKWEDLSVNASLGIFHNASRFPEYHAMLCVTNAMLDAEKQYACIESAIHLLLKQLPDTEIVWKRYFVSDAINQHKFIPSKQNSAAISVVQQPPLNGMKVSVWLYLIPKGFCFSASQATIIAHSGYRHLFHTQMFAKTTGETEQTMLIFRQYANLLRFEGCSLACHCARTWIFVQDIDTRYSGMVAARKEYFHSEGLTNKTHYIASTGIEGKYLCPDTLVFMDAYAIDGLQSEQIRYLHAPTHLNPTHEYGVTFERGTTIQYGDRRHVFISGTASINNRGEIVAPLDVLQQTKRVFENIQTLLNEAGSDMQDIAYMIVYLRDISDYSVVDAWLARKYPHIPKVVVWASVCRPGWLIEAECMAITATQDERFGAF